MLLWLDIGVVTTNPCVADFLFLHFPLSLHLCASVIALTTRIQQLQTHMAKHRKDKHSKRGMDALYVRRRKLLDYMERKDYDSYRRVVKTLGLIR